LDTPLPLADRAWPGSALAVVAPGAAHTARRLGLGLDRVAVITNRLLIGRVIRTAFGQWDAVIADGGERHAPSLLAWFAQRLAPEQISAHGLQPAAGDAFRFLGRCGPGLLRMPGTPAAAVTHQRPTPRVTARSGRSNWHGLNGWETTIKLGQWQLARTSRTVRQEHVS
jgi:hypothetical protein